MEAETYFVTIPHLFHSETTRAFDHGNSYIQRMIKNQKLVYPFYTQYKYPSIQSVSPASSLLKQQVSKSDYLFQPNVSGISLCKSASNLCTSHIQPKLQCDCCLLPYEPAISGQHSLLYMISHALVSSNCTVVHFEPCFAVLC